MTSLLASVIIVTYKRRETLLRSLESVRQQSYANREVIVVDNHSEDGTVEFLREHAPEVRVIELGENRGPCGGRNAGIEASRGDIIVTLDNDVLFASPLELAKTVALFSARKNIQVVAYRICDEVTGALRVREWCHPRSWQEYADTPFETNFFGEGACAARREVYTRAGLYYEPLFIGCEGWDLALRILDQGFTISYEPSIRVWHLMSNDTRPAARPFHLYTRNYIWIAFKDYPFVQGVRFLGEKLAMMAYFSLRSGHFGAYLRGLRDGVMGLRQVLRDRSPIKPQTVARLRWLESFRPGLVARLSRHREAVQL